MAMTCKRCGLTPVSAVRESGDTRWPATMRGYCLDCTFTIVGEWESNKGEVEALKAHLKDAIEMRDRFHSIVSRPSGILTVPNPITDETAERIKSAFKAAYSGPIAPNLEIQTKERRGFLAWLSGLWVR